MSENYEWRAIKAHVNIVDVIGQSLPLKKIGGLWKACCPLHGERTPSFTVYEGADPHYHCFGCGAHGDVLDWIVATHNCSTVEAAKILGGEDFRMTAEIEKKLSDHAKRKKQEAEEATAKARRRWERAEPADPANAYLMVKGVEPHGVRQEGDKLLVPVYDRHGEIQSVQSIEALPDGKSAKLFQAGAPMKGGRLNLGIAIGRVLVCEGFATGASIWESVSDAVRISFSKDGVKDMVRECLELGTDVAIAADRKGLPEILEFAQKHNIPVFVPTAPHDDFNDMAQAEGCDAVAAILRGHPVVDVPEVVKKDAPTADNDDSEPVDVWMRNAPPSLPTGLLPPLLERFARTRARMIGADAGGLAMSALAVCAAAIPDTVCVKVKQHESWTENARLWVMLIGDPSSKKSPIMRAAASKLSKMDGEMLREHERALIKWQRDKKDGIEKDKPAETRLRIEDITMEAAQEVCRWSPNGVLALQDELSGWFGGIEKYAGGKGSAKDRSFWLRAYNGGEYAVNRISRASFLIDNLSVSILGGIQPDALRKIMQDATEDGLIQRFLPVVLPSATVGLDEEMPDVSREYDDLVEGLRHVKPPANMFGPKPLEMSEGARAIRSRLEKEHHQMMIALERISKKFAAHIGKFDGMFPRLCVIWHCIEHINAKELPGEISEATADRCARFLHGYVLGQSKAFYHGVLGLSEDQEQIEDVAGYILAHNIETVTLRTFNRGSTNMRKLTKQNVEPICQQLEALGWLESIDSRGERFSCKVNPRVHEVYAEKAERERERRQEIVETIQKLVRQA